METYLIVDVKYAYIYIMNRLKEIYTYYLNISIMLLLNADKIIKRVSDIANNGDILNRTNNINPSDKSIKGSAIFLFNINTAIVDDKHANKQTIISLEGLYKHKHDNITSIIIFKILSKFNLFTS